MVRTQIQLGEDPYRRLREISTRQGRSMADCIREGIALFLQKSESQATDLSAIAGKYPPQPTTDLKPHDDWWAASVVGDREGGDE